MRIHQKSGVSQIPNESKIGGNADEIHAAAAFTQTSVLQSPAHTLTQDRHPLHVCGRTLAGSKENLNGIPFNTRIQEKVTSEQTPRAPSSGSRLARLINFAEKRGQVRAQMNNPQRYVLAPEGLI